MPQTADHIVEIWKPIPGYENTYEVSNLSNIRSIDRRVPLGSRSKFVKGQPIKPTLHHSGYMIFSLAKNGRAITTSVHRIVAQLFVDNPHDLPEVNHIRPPKTNNRADNLEWVTQAQNLQHAVETGLINRKGDKNIKAKLKESDVVQINWFYMDGMSSKEISEKYSVHQSSIVKILNGTTWGHISFLNI